MTFVVFLEYLYSPLRSNTFHCRAFTSEVNSTSTTTLTIHDGGHRDVVTRTLRRPFEEWRSSGCSKPRQQPDDRCLSVGLVLRSCLPPCDAMARLLKRAVVIVLWLAVAQCVTSKLLLPLPSLISFFCKRCLVFCLSYLIVNIYTKSSKYVGRGDKMGIKS